MIGFRIFPLQSRIDAQWVKKFKTIPVANVSDVMARMSAGGICLRPMHAGGVLAGPAFTVKTRPGDNLMVHKALSMAAPGDVIVVDAGGDLTNAIIGEIMTATAERRGLAGIVIHGAIRDAGTIAKNGFPVYAGGVTHRGPYKDGPGEINVPISLNGMVIQPGDLVLGDEDGLLCVPMEEAAAVYEAAHAKHELEAQILADIAQDKLDTDWIDQALTRLNCEVMK
ncbi:RraA family protein [Pollutimonas harenae]|uniref:Putative 4-hydroxy-4-methyl-2-oxoglutarate aldolase n=1 Tax=Pollutimonas harenae TaxID=657015 RepID=A0A853GRP3_9BURK|nr:RraA family protein [Pollutimonas harenae]NYT84841.1 RraA family protein [Pollutimonas harenae]TEA72761.1 RraA family protein [Pollutimonas harenae]